jgi:hypothetical protein
LNHFEQECNAMALKNMGVMVLKHIDHSFATNFQNWVHDTKSIQLHLKYTTSEMVDILIKKALN